MGQSEDCLKHFRKRMDFQERSELVDRIVLGYSVYRIRDIDYLVRDPGPNERKLSENYYKMILDSLMMSGVPTESEILASLMDRNIIAADYEEQIKKKQDAIKDLRKELPRLEFKSVTKQEVLMKIELIEAELSSLHQIKFSALCNSAEYLAMIERYRYLLFLCTYQNGQKYWSAFETFLSDDYQLIQTLMTMAFFDKRFSETVIRELARSEPWRNMWVAAIKIGHLFDKPTSEMSDLQKALLSWSMTYDYAYESMDSPSEEVINNDILFDAWLQEQSAKRKNEKKAKITSNAQEVGIMVDSVEDAKKVYELNGPMAKSILKERDKTIDKLGSVKVADLPDQQRELQMQRNRMVTRGR